jgi:hypothetical protein
MSIGLHSVPRLIKVGNRVTNQIRAKFTLVQDSLFCELSG